MYSSRCQNKNSELSYEAELSYLSKSSISLPREKKKSAIFGSQQTTTLEQRQRLVSVAIGEVKTSIDNTTGQRSLFLDSRFFFSTRLEFFSTHISKFRLMFFFSFVNIYFANVDSYFLLYSMYFTSFDMFLLSVQFCPQRNAIHIAKKNFFLKKQLNKSFFLICNN